MAHVESKTWSLGQILEKSCIRTRDHIFILIIMNFDQHVCLDEFSHKFENGSCGVKNWVTKSNLRKTLCTL